jgi:putative DNA primase/helicase
MSSTPSRTCSCLPELEERPDPLANIKPLPQVQFDHEWEYKDENKRTVFVKHRFKIGESGKTYRLYKVDADGRRHTTLSDARIVPYNLPELLEAKTAGRVIYLVEGEKAADALATIRVTATTAHTGAGSWPEAITEYFAGANVVILPDNDLAGWGYAQKAVDAILPIAKNVKVVDLKLQGKGDDAYEFIHEQKTVEKT